METGSVGSGSNAPHTPPAEPSWISWDNAKKIAKATAAALYSTADENSGGALSAGVYVIKASGGAVDKRFGKKIGNLGAKAVLKWSGASKDNDDQLLKLKIELSQSYATSLVDRLITIILPQVKSILLAKAEDKEALKTVSGLCEALAKDPLLLERVLDKQLSLVLVSILEGAPPLTEKQQKMDSDYHKLEEKIKETQEQCGQLQQELSELVDDQQVAKEKIATKLENLQTELGNDEKQLAVLKSALEHIALGRILGSVSKLIPIPQPNEDLKVWSKTATEVLIKKIFPQGATDTDLLAGIRNNLSKSLPGAGKIGTANLGLDAHRALLESILLNLGSVFQNKQQNHLQVADEFIDKQMKSVMAYALNDLTGNPEITPELEFANAVVMQGVAPVAKTLLTSAINLEKEKKASLDQEVGALVLNAVAEHMKVYNKVKASGAVTTEALVDAAQKAGVLHAASATEEIEKVYQPYISDVLRMLCPNGADDLAFISPELRQTTYDSMEHLLPQQLPALVDTCINKFLSPRFAKELVLKIMDNEVKRRHNKTDKAGQVAVEKKLVGDHTSGKMNESVGKLSEQVLALLDLSTLPNLIKHYIQDKDGKIKPKYQELVTNMLLEQFSGNFLEATLQAQVDASKLPQFKLPSSDQQIQAARSRIDPDRSQKLTDAQWNKAVQIVRSTALVDMTELELDTALIKALNSELSEEGLDAELAHASRLMVKTIMSDTIKGFWNAYQDKLDSYCATLTLTKYAKIALDYGCRFVFFTCIGTILTFLFKDLILRATYRMINLDVNRAALIEFFQLPENPLNATKKINDQEQANVTLFHKSMLLRIMHDLKASVERLAKQETSTEE